MIAVDKKGVILSKRALEFECEGVLNPAAIRVAESVHMFYRAVGKGNYSTIGYCVLNGPETVAKRRDTPLLFPQFAYESQGVEDPRITEIDGLYYFTYTAYDGVNALGALAVSTDLIHWEKRGLIVPKISYSEFIHSISCKGVINEKYERYNIPWQDSRSQTLHKFIWDKNVIFFPRRINGNLCFLHRIRPDIQLVSVRELKDLTPDFWTEYLLNFDEHIALSSKHNHEVSYIGGGCTPIETEHGWLIIYHGVHDTPKGYVYTACAALLDLDDPRKEIARLPYPLFKPELDWELVGEVNNVCFPTGAVVFEETLHIYYGAADEQIACATLSLTELIHELLLNKKLK